MAGKRSFLEERVFRAGAMSPLSIWLRRVHQELKGEGFSWLPWQPEAKVCIPDPNREQIDNSLGWLSVRQVTGMAGLDTS